MAAPAKLPRSAFELRDLETGSLLLVAAMVWSAVLFQLAEGCSENQGVRTGRSDLTWCDALVVIIIIINALFVVWGAALFLKYFYQKHQNSIRRATKKMRKTTRRFQRGASIMSNAIQARASVSRRNSGGDIHKDGKGGTDGGQAGDDRDFVFIFDDTSSGAVVTTNPLAQSQMPLPAVNAGEKPCRPSSVARYEKSRRVSLSQVVTTKSDSRRRNLLRRMHTTAAVLAETDDDVEQEAGTAVPTEGETPTPQKRRRPSGNSKKAALLRARSRRASPETLRRKSVQEILQRKSVQEILERKEDEWTGNALAGGILQFLT